MSVILVRLEAKIDRLADDLEKTTLELANMRERIYGNGKPGVLADVAEARAQAAKALESIASRDRLLGTLGGIILTLVVGMLWSIFTGQWRLVVP